MINSFYTDILNTSYLISYVLIFFIFIISFITRKFEAYILLAIVKKVLKIQISKKTNHWITNIIKPFRIVYLNIFLTSAILIFSENSINIYLIKINKCILIILIFWTIICLLSPLIEYLNSKNKVLSSTLSSWFTSSIKYILIVFSLIIILEIWGIRVAPIVAGLGLFGIAVALGAQDLFKNLISGMLIIFEKRFQIGDIIEVTNHVVGTVEHVGFRSTIIRKFDTTEISVPNYIFAETPIVNFSNRKYRRINKKIGVTYDTSTVQLKKITTDIRSYIVQSNEFIVNDEYSCTVRVENFNDSSIDIMIYCFTNTVEWARYLEINEKLSLEVKSILKQNNSSFAFPTRSIIIEKDL